MLGFIRSSARASCSGWTSEGLLNHIGEVGEGLDVVDAVLLARPAEPLRETIDIYQR